MGFRKSWKPFWKNKTNLLFVVLDQTLSQKRKTEIVGLILPDRSHPHRPTSLTVPTALMAIGKPFVILTKRLRTEIHLVRRVEMELFEIAGISDHVLTNVITG